MIILHVCSITNNKSSGISNVVPEHFLYQREYANIGLLNCNDIEIERLKGEKNVFYLKEIQGKIENLPNPFNTPDLVVFHGIYIPQYIKISRYLIKKKIKYIIIPHGSLTKESQDTKKIKKKLANMLMFNNFINNAICIQYLSTREKQGSEIFKNKNFVMGNGMNKSKYVKTLFNKKGIRLIYVGRYSIFHKGLDILVDACDLAHEDLKENNVCIDLYGSGNADINKLKKIVEEKKLKDIIHINGPIYSEEKLTEIIDHDLFIQVSRSEGQPLGIMEAMSLGMPLIVSYGTTFGDIVKENKLGYVCSTKQEVADVLRKLPKCREEFYKMSKNSVKYAIENFSWDKISRETVEKYTEIASEMEK